MSVSNVRHDEITCNGDGRMPCGAFFTASGYGAYAAETRKEARGKGWEVNVASRWGRRRLDFCPEHRETPDTEQQS